MLNTRLPHEEELSAPIATCPICGFSGRREETVTLQSEPEVSMRHCPNCGGDSAERMPRSEFLNEIYDPKRYKGHVISTDSLREKCANRILKYAKVGDEPYKILDFGGGDGSLAITVSEHLKRKHPGLKTEPYVVDLFAPKDSSVINYLSPEEFQKTDMKFDVVIASAVIEHLTEVNKDLRKLFEVCKPSGIFYARTPYEVPLARLSFGNYKIKWPRHLHDLGPEFWNKSGQTFNCDLETLYSGPSFVESTFSTSPTRTLLAHILKVPGFIENAVRSGGYTPAWKLVGGWEFIARIK